MRSSLPLSAPSNAHVIKCQLWSAGKWHRLCSWNGLFWPLSGSRPHHHPSCHDADGEGGVEWRPGPLPAWCLLCFLEELEQGSAQASAGFCATVIFLQGFPFTVPWPSHPGPRKAFLCSPWHLAMLFIATGFQTLNILIWKAPLFWSPLGFYVFWAAALVPLVPGPGGCLPTRGFPKLGAAVASWLPFSTPPRIRVYVEPSGDGRELVGLCMRWFPTSFFPPKQDFAALTAAFIMALWSWSICPWITQSCWWLSLTCPAVWVGEPVRQERLHSKWRVALFCTREKEYHVTGIFQAKKDYCPGSGSQLVSIFLPTKQREMAWTRSKGELK